MEREALKVKDSIVFIDEYGVRHPALVTRVWTGFENKPGVNIVFVSGDESKDDQYGRQIERRTSLCHLSVQPAKASCWCYPDE